MRCKRVATRAAKKCMTKALAADEAPDAGEPSLPLQQRCDEVDAQIAAADRRLASLHEDLRRPAPLRDLEPLHVLGDLCDRLSADGGEVVAVPEAAGFEESVDKCVGGFLAASASCQRLLSRLRELQRVEQERNSELSSAAHSDLPAPGDGGGARGVLLELP